MHPVARKLLLGAAAVFAALPATGTALAAGKPFTPAVPRPPFGSTYRPVCEPPPPGRVRCLADVLTVGSAVSAVPLVTATPLGYGPANLQSAYGIAGEAATLGDSQTVAVIDAYDDPTAESDLATYRSQYGLPACTTANGCFRKVDQTGGSNYPPADAGWDDEISLDLDAVSAICPRCHLLLVEADNGDLNDVAAAVDEAATLGATEISNSYGGPEFAGESAFDPDYDHPGIAVTASSGDGGYGVSYPAASRYVTAVGGTSLTPAPATARGWAEVAWPGAGSGCSRYEAKPPWQLDIGCANRTVADVSAVADPATGAAVYSSSSGGWVVYGGTSLSSPIIAAYDALTGAAASPQYAYANLGSYFDITSGSNGSCGTYLCDAGIGYDGPTGLGTPNGAGIPGASTAATDGASGVTDSTATLNGSVSPHGNATTYYFQYGTTGSYGSATATAGAGSDLTLHGVSASVTGLAVGTAYQFRIVAASPSGVSAGAGITFTTGSGPSPTTGAVTTATAPPPATPVPQTNPNRRAVLAPSITRLALRPTAFRDARRAGVARAIGTRVTFTLSAAAYVTFSVERELSGRLINKRCVSSGADNRRRPACVRFLSGRDVFRYPGSGFAAAGPHGLGFTGRRAGALLTAARYRLVAVAHDATGRSLAARAGFRVLP